MKTCLACIFRIKMTLFLWHSANWTGPQNGYPFNSSTSNMVCGLKYCIQFSVILNNSVVYVGLYLINCVIASL